MAIAMKALMNVRDRGQRYVGMRREEIDFVNDNVLRNIFLERE